MSKSVCFGRSVGRSVLNILKWVSRFVKVGGRELLSLFFLENDGKAENCSCTWILEKSTKELVESSR